MPQYLLLLYVPTGDARPAPDELAAEHPKWIAYTEQLRDAGVLVAGEALEEIDTATTVRVRAGETLMTDGPFAETKEALAGYYVIEAPDLDDALRWAARVPNATYGSVEVRPVRVFADMPSA